MALSSTSSVQPFTRANVFGTILTLQLCQFTQPSGSLIFPSHAGLFWRSNPIASLLEGCMIICYLSSALFARSPGERSLSAIERIKNVGYVLLLYRRGDLPQHEEIWTTETESKLLDCMRADGGASRWFIISLITTVLEVATFVKILGVSGVPFLRALITCMVFAWLCVQSMQLCIPSTNEMQESLPQIQRTAEYIRSRMEDERRLWMTLLNVFHIPLFAFLGYKATGTPSDDLINAMEWLNIVVTLYIWVGLIWFFFRYRYLPMPRTIAYLLGSSMLSSKHTNANRNRWMIGRAVNFLLVFEVTFVVYAVSVLETNNGEPFRQLVNFFIFRHHLSDPIPSVVTRKVPSAANVVVAIGIFATYIVAYDQEGTNKASWTDWLG